MTEGTASGSFEKFFDVLLPRIQEIVKEVESGDRSEHGEAHVQFLLFGGPEPVSDRKLGHRDLFFAKLSQGYVEISRSYERLTDAATYVGRFPYGDTSISRASHLRYHVENYINEVSLLKNRLECFFKVIRRCYRKSEQSDWVQTALGPLPNFVRQTFGNMSIIRNSHVHDRRFTEPEFERLESLELLARSELGNHLLIRSQLKQAYRQLRKRWKSDITSYNQRLKEVLDYCFSCLLMAVTNDQGELDYPRSQ